MSSALTAKIIKLSLCVNIATLVALTLRKPCFLDCRSRARHTQKYCAAICSELNEHLAGVLPAEQTDKGFGSLLQPVFDRFTAFDGS
jgi:hypothetical protein